MCDRCNKWVHFECSEKSRQEFDAHILNEVWSCGHLGNAIWGCQGEGLRARRGFVHATVRRTVSGTVSLLGVLWDYPCRVGACLVLGLRARRGF